MTAETWTPGVYDLADEVYHADPVPGGSLSSSGAKKLLPPSCPAIFHYQRTHRPPPTNAFTIGHAAHKLVLGIGPTIVVVEADNWTTKKAKDAKAAALAEGMVPLLSEQFEEVTAMAAALAADPIAGPLFRKGAGTPEASLFWNDDETGVKRRCRLDWLPTPVNDHMVIPDYKTAISANPAQLGRAFANFGYHMQAAWNLDGVHDLYLADSASFVFVVQEKTAPYLVSVVEPDAEALRIGNLLNREALALYARCEATGTWPGYSSGITRVSLPWWYAKGFEDE